MTFVDTLNHRARGLWTGREAMLAALPGLAFASWSLLLEVADPRGRCNRKAFLHIALTFLALQTTVAGLLWLAGVQLGQTGALLSNAPIFWIGTTVCIKRLHDVGRRGWWIPAAFVGWFVGAMAFATAASLVVGEAALNAGEPAFLVVFVGICLPAFAALVWLHCAPSMPTDNRFGPVATGLGLSMPPVTRNRLFALRHAAAILMVA